MELSVNTKISFKDYLKLVYTLKYRKASLIVMTIIGAIMFFTGILAYNGNLKLNHETPGLRIFVGVLILIGLPIAIYVNAKRMFFSSKPLQENVKYTFTDEKILTAGESFNSEVDWKNTYKITELDSWILIYQNKLSAFMIPKKSFGDELGDFEAFLRRRNFTR